MFRDDLSTAQRLDFTGNASLAAASGIHRATDALKMLMAGAYVTMLCSILLRRGIEHIRVIEREMREWMEEHEYESIEQPRSHQISESRRQAQCRSVPGRL